jgi:hypothetical protein
MKKIIIAALFVFAAVSVQAQEGITTVRSNRSDQFSIGPGFGLDYGGIGINALFYPQENIGVFAGAGYDLNGLGYNVGIKARLMTNRRIDPYLLAMYGYNAVIVVADASIFNKTFYGPSFGVGMDFRSRKPMKTGYWSLAILVPIRGSEVEAYSDDLEDHHGIKFDNELIPVGISIGYHFIIK